MTQLRNRNIHGLGPNTQNAPPELPPVTRRRRREAATPPPDTSVFVAWKILIMIIFMVGSGVVVFKNLEMKVVPPENDVGVNGPPDPIQEIGVSLSKVPGRDVIYIGPYIFDKQLVVYQPFIIPPSGELVLYWMDWCPAPHRVGSFNLLRPILYGVVFVVVVVMIMGTFMTPGLPPLAVPLLPAPPVARLPPPPPAVPLTPATTTPPPPISPASPAVTQTTNDLPTLVDAEVQTDQVLSELGLMDDAKMQESEVLVELDSMVSATIMCSMEVDGSSELVQQLKGRFPSIYLQTRIGFKGLRKCPFGKCGVVRAHRRCSFLKIHLGGKSLEEAVNMFFNPEYVTCKCGKLLNPRDAQGRGVYLNTVVHRPSEYVIMEVMGRRGVLIVPAEIKLPLINMKARYALAGISGISTNSQKLTIIFKFVE